MGSSKGSKNKGNKKDPKSGKKASKNHKSDNKNANKYMKYNNKGQKATAKTTKSSGMASKKNSKSTGSGKKSAKNSGKTVKANKNDKLGPTKKTAKASGSTQKKTAKADNYVAKKSGAKKEAKSQHIVGNWVFTGIVIFVIVGGLYWMITRVFIQTFPIIEEPNLTLNTMQEFQRPLIIANEPTDFLQSIGVFKPPLPSSLTLN